MSAAQFDTGFAVSDAAIAGLARMRSVFTDAAPAAQASACDLGQLALAVGAATPLVLTEASEEPLELAVLAPTPFKIAAQMLGGCAQHPELIHVGPAGRLARTGPEGQALMVTSTARWAEPRPT